jgi:hypothetical protein
MVATRAPESITLRTSHHGFEVIPFNAVRTTYGVAHQGIPPERNPQIH